MLPSAEWVHLRELIQEDLASIAANPRTRSLQLLRLASAVLQVSDSASTPERVLWACCNSLLVAAALCAATERYLSESCWVSRSLDDLVAQARVAAGVMLRSRISGQRPARLTHLSGLHPLHLFQDKW
jgi:hypothetical protein